MSEWFGLAGACTFVLATLVFAIAVSALPFTPTMLAGAFGWAVGAAVGMNMDKVSGAFGLGDQE